MLLRLRNLVLAAVLLSGLAIAGVAPVFAQNAQGDTNRVANGFRVSPVRSELTIEKGKKQDITVTVENPTDIPTVAKSVVNDFIASEDESGSPRLILDDKVAAPKNSFKALVGTLGDVSLGAREKKDIKVTVAIPADANSGGYYGAIRFVPANTGEVSNVGLTASVGTIVLVTVPGNLVEKAALVELSAAQNGNAKSFLTKGDVSVLVRLKNTGDIHVKPFGRVEVKNMFGKTVTTYELNNTEPRSNMLPGSTRKFVNDVNGKKWFGRYTVTANLGFSQGSGDLITAKAVFWYVPMWAVYVLIVLVLALVVGGYLLFRRMKANSRHHK